MQVQQHPVTVIAIYKVAPDQLGAVLTALENMAMYTRQEAGCLVFHIYQQEGEPSTLYLHEKYEDQAAAEAHKQSAHYSQYVATEIVPRLLSRDVARLDALFSALPDMGA